MPQLIWSDKAASDLEDIHDYIAKDSIFYAVVQVDRLVKSVERLQKFPESGRTLPEYPNTSYREVVCVPTVSSTVTNLIKTEF